MWGGPQDAATWAGRADRAVQLAGARRRRLPTTPRSLGQSAEQTSETEDEFMAMVTEAASCSLESVLSPWPLRCTRVERWPSIGREPEVRSRALPDLICRHSRCSVVRQRMIERLTSECLAYVGSAGQEVTL